MSENALRERFEKETGIKADRWADVYELLDVESKYSEYLEDENERLHNVMGKWISVNDGLPEESTPMKSVKVWAYDPKHGGIDGKARYIKSLGWNFDGSPQWVDSVTHWMPLPEKPLTQGGK